MEIRQESLVERQAADMLGTVNAESIYAHLDEASVALAQILIYSGILGVEVNTVSYNLTNLFLKSAITHACIMMPVVMAVVVFTI